MKELVRRLPGILTDQQIKRLKEHKYASEGTTLLDPYMQIFWKRLVEYCPLWVAPNLVTIIGLAINIATSISLLILTDGAREQVGSRFFAAINARLI
jgi:choline/ethanolamine phosphotransferase